MFGAFLRQLADGVRNLGQNVAVLRDDLCSLTHERFEDAFDVLGALTLIVGNQRKLVELLPDERPGLACRFDEIG